VCRDIVQARHDPYLALAIGSGDRRMSGISIDQPTIHGVAYHGQTIRRRPIRIGYRTGFVEMRYWRQRRASVRGREERRDDASRRDWRG